jgi:hypothetical protein
MPLLEDAEVKPFEDYRSVVFEGLRWRDPA